MDEISNVPESDNLNSSVLCTVCSSEFHDKDDVKILKDENYTKKVCQKCAQYVFKADESKIRLFISETLPSIITPNGIKIEVVQFGPAVKLNNIFELDDHPSIAPKIENDVVLKAEDNILGANDIKLENKEIISSIPNESSVQSTSVLPIFFNNKSLDKHYCCKCTDIYTNQGELMDHFMQNHLDSIDSTIELQTMNQNIHQCPLCRKLFARKYAVAKHKRTKHRSEKAEFPCKICLRVYSRRYYAEKCEQTDNGTLKKLPCPRKGCSILLKTKDNLKSHLRLHDFPDLARFTCEICGQKSKKVSSFKTHAETHTEEKNYECHICGKKLKSRSTIETHMRVHINTGVGVRSFQCEKCPKNYMYHKDLKQHLLIHTGVKQFKCPFLECAKAFFNRKHMKRHEKTHKKMVTHTGDLTNFNFQDVKKTQ